MISNSHIPPVQSVYQLMAMTSGQSNDLERVAPQHDERKFPSSPPHQSVNGMSQEKKVENGENPPPLQSDELFQKLDNEEKEIIFDMVIKWKCSPYQDLLSLFGMEMTHQINQLKITPIIKKIKIVFFNNLFNIYQLFYQNSSKNKFPKYLFTKEVTENQLSSINTGFDKYYKKNQIVRIKKVFNLFLKIFHFSDYEELFFNTFIQKGSFSGAKNFKSLDQNSQKWLGDLQTTLEMPQESLHTQTKIIPINQSLRKHIHSVKQNLEPLEEINSEITKRDKILTHLISYTELCHHMLQSWSDLKMLSIRLDFISPKFQELISLFKTLQKDNFQGKAISENDIKKVILTFKKNTKTEMVGIVKAYDKANKNNDDDSNVRANHCTQIDRFFSQIHTLFDKMWMPLFYPDYSPIKTNRKRIINLLNQFPQEPILHPVIPSPVPFIPFNQKFCELILPFEKKYSDLLKEPSEKMKIPILFSMLKITNNGKQNNYWLSNFENYCHIDDELVNVKKDLITVQQEVVKALKNELAALQHGISQEEANAFIAHINEVTYRQSQLIISIVTIYEDLDTIRSEDVSLEPKQLPIELANLIKLDGLEELLAPYIISEVSLEASPSDEAPPARMTAAPTPPIAPTPNPKNNKKKTKKAKFEQKIREIRKRHLLVKRLKADGFYKVGKLQGHANAGHDLYVHQVNENFMISVPRHDQISKGVARSIEDQVAEAIAEKKDESRKGNKAF